MSKNKSSVDNLIDLQSQYIKLLENECSSLSVFAYVNGRQSLQEDVKKGQELRDKIKELKNENKKL